MIFFLFLVELILLLLKTFIKDITYYYILVIENLTASAIANDSTYLLLTSIILYQEKSFCGI